ncbi:Opr family porin [Sulfurospirillum oryzae]|uniref:Opr family porin n=1 Tax=Sulfurospirillum oryzae TaxID=2976535 RepID=UPI0021E7F307|nr:Opr family porin [Sulfurospirillum oryzae]
MQLRYSRMIAAIVLGSSLSVAGDATNLEEAFANGKIEGTIGWFGQHIDAKEGTNSGFSNGYVNIGFETAPIHGVSLGVSGWGSLKISEKNDDDYKTSIADPNMLSQAFVKVEHEGMGRVVLGRQAVDFNWLSDYIEGATFEFSSIENLVLNMAWARKYAVVDIDEVSNKFGKINGNDGIYMLEAKYMPMESLELNPYFYYGENLLNTLGFKVTLNLALNEEVKTKTMLHYASIDSAVSGTPNGSFTQVEQGVSLFGVSAALGYIKVDKEGMAELGTFGDQLPFEEHNHTFDKDAKTPYISALYEVEGVKLSAIYAETKYLDTLLANKLKEKEFNVKVSYEVLKNIETSLLYANVKNDDIVQSYDAIKAHIFYKF